SIANEQAVFKLSDSIEISQYVRTEVELRFNKQINAEQSFVGRFNVAAARPFGFTTDVPYVKQFFVGGANSMRGWAQRGLGPGGYLDPLSLNPDNNFRLFQTGDFKMEMNLEYRFPIALWFKGAIFMDVGNVWTFEKDDDRPGSQFLLSSGEDLAEFPFYKQFAVAAGLGLRVDVSYFIFRFDVGSKLRNSFPSYLIDDKSQPESAWWNDFQDVDASDFGFNVGLGMPF
ncbi:MAG: BamA/TamA family outer membrane protein, partial [Bacteroidota bacterium]